MLADSRARLRARRIGDKRSVSAAMSTSSRCEAYPSPRTSKDWRPKGTSFTTNQPSVSVMTGVLDPSTACPYRIRSPLVLSRRDPTSTDVLIGAARAGHRPTAALAYARLARMAKWSKRCFAIPIALLTPNGSRLSCGALMKDSFHNLRAPPASSAC